MLIMKAKSIDKDRVQGTCPHCSHVHTHSSEEGYRVPHCDGVKEQYYIKIVK